MLDKAMAIKASFTKSASCSSGALVLRATRMRRFALVCLLLVVAPLARAERREVSVGVSPIYAAGYLPDRTGNGGGGVGHIQFGITDAVSILAFGGASYHPLPADPDKKLLEGSLLAWHASVGVAYALDIVRIQPFFEAAVGVISLTSKIGKDVSGGLQAGVAVGVGADYLLNRRFSFGFAFRYHGVLTDLGNIPLYLTVGPRAQVRFWM